MPGALLDTNTVSDLMRDDPKVKARLASYAGPLTTSVVVAGEIRYGLERLPVGKKRTDLQARAQAILSALTHEPITLSIAETYGQLKAALEIQGLNLDDNDLWIAATAVVQGAILVTRDRLFRHIAGIQIDDWSV